MADRRDRLIIIAVAALAVGIAILWERSATFRKIIEGAFHAVLSVVKTVWNWIKTNWPLLAGILLGPDRPRGRPSSPTGTVWLTS